MRTGKGIVKSGNAGNSSKSEKNQPTASTSTEPPPLFPPGSKYPLSLLHERCRKLGWDKPIVDTRAHGTNGFSFVVTLSNHNNKTSQKDTVRMEPHPPYYRPTALEARHWGATYALYRFCNGMQFNQILPPGPREYWKELAAEHKKIEEHQKWMYDADPFLAQRLVQERQAKAAQRKQEAAIPPGTTTDDHRFKSRVSAEYPEVIMATHLRELVENAIKKGFELYPEEADSLPLTLSPEIVPEIAQHLVHLDFKKAQVQDATTFLSQESPLTFKLLGSLSPLEAAIEYLVLHLPECDLPQRFLPTNNSSNPFITAAHSGTDDLKRRWSEDKAVKEAGWPLQAVKECTMAEPACIQRWDLLMVALGRKLIGGQIEDVSTVDPTPYSIEVEEYEALGAHLEEDGHLVLPLFSAPIKIHILFSEAEQYPRPGYIPIYATSTTAAAYVRLHLISQFLSTMKAKPDLEPGEGFCMAVLQIIEAEWAAIEDNGPPDISTVLKNLLPPPRKFVPVADGSDINKVFFKSAKQQRSKDHSVGNDLQIRRDFESTIQSDKYQAILKKREKLPAFEARVRFLDKLENNRVVVVVGETGCGKTTQLPQFILDALIISNRGSQASILVTQPRRISAISVAARVSEERLDDGSVGYAIRGESKQGKNTKLLFCTTGVVLRRLSTGDTLRNVSHVVVDEVHERSMDGDFLLLELKELLKTHPTIKIVLMSATINHETFVKYFDNAPLLTIPGFMHPVVDNYLEDILSVTGYRPPFVKSSKGKGPATGQEFRDEYESQGITTSVVDAIQNIIRSERIDHQLIATLVNHIIATAEGKGGILIFLPGVNEIRQCVETIRKSTRNQDTTVLPLHANLSNEEQKKVFQPTKGWKVIAATNVAETSITIDDIVYVIDAGRVKETQYDPDTNMSRLVETWVNRAAARQRRGRAGRTRPGVCYKLYTRKQEINMASFPVPEILRVPLESISLSVKATREDEDVKAFLSKAIDPPAITAIDRALNTLEELGATDEDGNLTPLGRHISMIPVDIRLAKMLVLATIFQCLGPITTVAALLSSKPLFISPMDKREESTAARARFFTGDSDILTDVNAFDECMRMRAEGQSQGAIKAFCEENFISSNTLREIGTLRQDFISSLAEIGLVPLSSTPSTPALNTSSSNLNLVKAAMLGGLWPRVARVHLPEDRIKYDKVSAGTIQRENTAKDFKIFDLKEGRVFLHPGSVMFGVSSWKPPFLFYFHKYMTSKVFLRDATKVPIYAILLFGGPVAVNHIRGGLTVGNKENFIKLSAIPRIGILVNQLRRLLDAELQKSIEEGTMLSTTSGNPVVHAIMALLTNDGRTEDFGINTQKTSGTSTPEINMAQDRRTEESGTIVPKNTSIPKSRINGPAMKVKKNFGPGRQD